MGNQVRVKAARLLVVGGVLLGLIAATVTWSHAGSRADAQVSPGLDFSIAVPSHSGCDTRHGDTVCVLDPGERFTVNVLLNALPADAAQYSGYDIEIGYTGVTSADNGNTHSWPDCGFPVTYFQPGLVAIGCAIGVAPAMPSTYTGVIGTNDFTCTASGTIKLVHGVGHTDLIDAGSQPHVEADSGAETLTISCGPLPTSTPPPVTATATATPAARVLPAGGTGAPSGRGVPWETISALLVVGAAALVLSSWRLVRSK